MKTCRYVSDNFARTSRALKMQDWKMMDQNVNDGIIET